MDWHDVVFYTAGGPIVITCPTREEALDVYRRPSNSSGAILLDGMKIRLGECVVQTEYFAIEEGAIIASALVRAGL